MWILTLSSAGLRSGERQMTQEPTEGSGSQPAARAASSKGDFAIPVTAVSELGRAELSLGIARQRMRMDSDKCDWRVATPTLQARGSDLSVTEDLQANFGAGRLRMDSDKCDWRIAVDDAVSRTVNVATVGPQLEVSTRSGGLRGEVRYGESDWVFEMAGARPGMTTPPVVRAEMMSDKCDFKIRLEVGVLGGPSVRMRAMGSDKCDFRIVEQPEEVQGPARPDQ
jgi:hypothetical protein